MKLELHRGTITKLLYLVDTSMSANTRNTVALGVGKTFANDAQLTKVFCESNKTLKPMMTEFMTAIKVSKLEPTVCIKDDLSTGNAGDQVGGTHYGEGTDVFDFSLEREHDCLQHSAIKYIDRHKLKNGEEDIRKAISVLERIIQEQYSD